MMTLEQATQAGNLLAVRQALAAARLGFDWLARDLAIQIVLSCKVCCCKMFSRGGSSRSCIIIMTMHYACGLLI